MKKGAASDRLELTAYSLLFVSSCIYEISSIRLGIGSLSNPGLGFFPFAIGLMLALSSLMIVVRTIQRVGWKLHKISSRWNRQKFQTLGTIAICFTFYLYTINQIGFLVSTFWLIIVALWLSGDRKLLSVLVISGLASATVDGLFAALLNVPLPIGILKV